MRIRAIATALCAACSATAPLASQESKAVFDAPLVVATEFQRIDRLLDFDADGDVDAIGHWRPSSRDYDEVITGYRNDGTGTLSVAWTVTHPSKSRAYYASHMAVGHLDSDKREDFVFLKNQRVTAYSSRGTSAPVAIGSFTRSQVERVGIGDFDGDGKNDIIAVGWAVYLYRNTGSGFTAHSSAGRTHKMFELDVADVNGDNYADAIVTGETATRIVLGSASGLTDGKLLVHGYRYADKAMQAAGDVDGDGDTDIVIFSVAGTYVIFRNDGKGGFTKEAPARGGPATDLADIDGDGDPDGVCCGSGGDGKYRNQWASTFHVAINEGKGKFAPAFTIAGLGSKNLAGVADLDKDGDVDMVGGRAIYYARGPLVKAPGAPVATKSWKRTRRFVDIDRDGDPDLEPSTDLVQWSDGDVGFTKQSPVLPAPPVGTWFIGPGYAGDFDGDQAIDLLVGHVKGGTFLGMRLLRNTGGGGYVDAGPAAAPGVNLYPFFNSRVPTVPPSGPIVDVDGDGDTDIVVSYANRSTAQTTIWLNDGKGFFSKGPFFGSEGVDRVAHLNADKLPDLVAINPGGTLGVRFGTKDGSFTAATVLSIKVDEYRDRFAVGDVDHDGDNDIVAVHKFNHAGIPILFTNDGTGSFAATRPFAAATTNRNAYNNLVHIADLNGDGRNDVSISPAAYGVKGTWIVLGKQGGGFEPQFMQMIESEIYVDLDGDGDLDVVGRECFRGTKFHGPRAGYRQQFGVATKGDGGFAPTLGASGPFRAGGTTTLHLTGTHGGTVVSLVFGAKRAAIQDFPFKGMVQHAFPILLALPLPVDGVRKPGMGSLSAAFDVPAGMHGLKLVLQGHVLDLSVPVYFTQTNGLELVFGR